MQESPTAPASLTTAPVPGLINAQAAASNVAALFAPQRLTVCVLGGSGFVGSELVVRLVRAGHSVRVLTRDLRHADRMLVLSSVQLLAGDIHGTTFLETAVADCDVVVNLIGILNQGRGHNTFREAHVELVRTLLRVMPSRARRLLHVSALGADAEHGASAYLRSKGAAERLIRAAHLDWTLFRPSVIFGPRDSLVNRFASLLRLSHGWLPLARAHSRFAPIYVGDVAEALMRCLHGDATRHQTYELGGPEIRTLGDIVRTTARAAHLPCHLIALPDSLGRLQAAVAGCLPGKPFSLDNFNSLSRDSVCAEDGCARLGIQPVSFSAAVTDMLRPRARIQPYSAYHGESSLRRS
jgi:NADH dehydrogenase